MRPEHRPPVAVRLQVGVKSANDNSIADEINVPEDREVALEFSGRLVADRLPTCLHCNLLHRHVLIDQSRSLRARFPSRSEAQVVWCCWSAEAVPPMWMMGPG